jgi:peptide/nickel transport system substrate-binding protein
MIVILNLGFAVASERQIRMDLPYPCYIDPAVGTDMASACSYVNLYDTLVYPDIKGDPQPHIAESWEVSEDRANWTFYLRSGIKFHDGTELTAEDVKFSMDRLKTIGEGFGYLFDEVSSVEVISKYTVVFHLEDSFGPFLMTLYRFCILNKDLVMANIKKPGPYGDMGDYAKQYLMTHDAGSGPYMVKEFPLAEYLLTIQNPNYWLPLDPNSPDEFKIILTTEPVTVRLMMSRRELEISDGWQPNEVLTTLDKIEGVDILNSFALGISKVGMMNTKKPPTDDIHFRKAIAWAVDYQTIVDRIYTGSIRSKGPVPQRLAGSDPTVFQYHRDLNKAMEELKQSKYYGQLDKYPVTVVSESGDFDAEKVGLLLMSNLNDIGIKVEVQNIPWAKIVDESAALETSPNIMTLLVAPHYPEAGSILSVRYKSSSVATYEQNEWLLDPKYDAMIEDALGTIDQEERFAKYSKLQQYIVDLCPTLFLADFVQKHAYQKAYIDWPAAKGEEIPIMGYNFAARFIKVYPDKRAELLK